ncbi:MAG TPA: DUF924 family protein [Pararhizobium sp.]|jgi:uncharacterized protein (DUF924 family)|nr:DUF924 family protein [Pararhizobium sp.]
MIYDDGLATPEEVLAFWFDELTVDDWFRKSDELDQLIARRFTATHLALAFHVDEIWRMAPINRLAAVIVLDQFPRNIYRGTPHAFATDPLALNEARTAVDAGMDQMVEVGRRQFFYMPFEHSEKPDDQERSVALFTALGNENYLDYARQHQAVIAEYGRFPHRNPILGRHSTHAEEAYLAKEDAGF